MTSKESEVLLTELIVMAEVGDTKKQDERYTVETINNVSRSISSPVGMWLLLAWDIYIMYL